MRTIVILKFNIATHFDSSHYTCVYASCNLNYEILNNSPAFKIPEPCIQFCRFHFQCLKKHTISSKANDCRKTKLCKLQIISDQISAFFKFLWFCRLSNSLNQRVLGFSPCTSLAISIRFIAFHFILVH